MVGPTQEMNEIEVSQFLETFLRRVDRSEFNLIHLGNYEIAGVNCAFLTNLNGIFAQYISKAFLKSTIVGKGEFHWIIWEDEEFWNSKECFEIRTHLRSQCVVSKQRGTQFHFAHHPYEGMIYLREYGTDVIYILLAPEPVRNLATFVTPFRVAVDWIAQDFGGMAIHASVIVKDEVGILLNGPSGSGKSTMGALALAGNYQILADDVVVAKKNKLFAVYSHAKLDHMIARSFFPSLEFFELPRDSQGKMILNLNSIGTSFRRTCSLRALVFPQITEAISFRRITNSESLRLMAPNTMRELLGGNSKSLSIMRNIIENAPSYQLFLNSNIEEGFSALEELISSEMKDD